MVRHFEGVVQWSEVMVQQYCFVVAFFKFQLAALKLYLVSLPSNNECVHESFKKQY